MNDELTLNSNTYILKKAYFEKPLHISFDHLVHVNLFDKFKSEFKHF